MMIDILTYLGQAIALAARAYGLLILASVMLSWLRPDPYNPVVRFIRRSTEPVVGIVRRALPFLRAGMIDFSPVVAMLLLELVSTLLVSLLQRVAEQQ